MYSRVPPKGCTSRLERCAQPQQVSRNATKAHLLLLMNSTTKGCEFTFHYWSPFGRRSNPLQQSWGTHPQLNWGLPSLEAHTHNLIGGSQVTTKGLDHKRSWPQKAGHKRRLGSKDPRVTSSQVSPPRILVEGSNRCKCNGKSTRSAQVLHSQIPTQQQMFMGE